MSVAARLAPLRAANPPRLDRSWDAVLRPGEAADHFRTPSPPFRPASRSFDPVNAWWLGELAGLVYRRGPEEDPIRRGLPPRERVLASAGLLETAAITNAGVFCALVRPQGPEPAFAAAVFRGTTRDSRWADVLDARPAALRGGGRVHRGFHNALERLWPGLEPRLRAFPGPWFYAGHSLGGALALLAAVRRPARAVYTFGAPRVGDADLMARLLRQAHFHLVTPWDPVPHLPRPVSRVPYAPLEPAWRFGRRGHLHPPNADPGLAGSADAIPWRQLLPRRRTPPEALSDHAPANYRARLAALLPDAPASF